MEDRLSDIKGLEIYSPKGIFVGMSDEFIIDVEGMRVEGIFVDEVNPYVAEEGISIRIPMDWVQSIGDVIILNRFPNDRISI